MSWFGPRTRGGGDWYSILFVSVTSANKDIIIRCGPVEKNQSALSFSV